MSEEWQHGDITSQIGKWAWIIGFLNGILAIIAFLAYIIISLPVMTLYPPAAANIILGGIWWIIEAIIMIIISLFIIRPKFSKKCAEKDWDALLNWTLNLGGLRLSWMLIWGIILEIFSWYYWGGLAILIPAFLLLFVGPKEYQWTVEKESS